MSETIFATLFVYGADNSARWYVASDLRGSASTFSGTLYQTNGPAFTATWTGTATVTPVGSMTLTFNSASTGTLSYTVNGATVNKQIQRQTFRPDNLSGNYIGGLTAAASGCTNPANNELVLATGLFRVAHGSSVSITVDFKNAVGTPGTCTYTGGYTAQGRLASISGNYSCTTGTSGTFTISELSAARSGWTGVYSGADNLGCRYSGYFGGLKDVI